MFTTLETIWLVLSSVLYGLALPITVVTALFVPMLFDAPGSTESRYVWLIAKMMLSAPVVLLITLIGVGVSVLLIDQRVLALVFSLLPLIHVAGFIIAINRANPRALDKT